MLNLIQYPLIVKGMFFGEETFIFMRNKENGIELIPRTLSMKLITDSELEVFSKEAEDVMHIKHIDFSRVKESTIKSINNLFD